MRDLNNEYQDTNSRQYAYDFDHVIRRYLLKRVRQQLNIDGSTLEVGAYKGDMTEMILGLFPRLTVVEGSSQLSDGIRERFGSRVDVVNQTIETFEPLERFDSIFLVHVLEHLDDPIHVLSRLGSMLTKAGKLLIAVPNAEALSRQLAVRMGVVAFGTAVTSSEFEHGHRRTYNLDTLRHATISAGLHIEEIGGVLVKPLSNSQFDSALKSQLINWDYLEACYQLSELLPHLSATIYVIASRGDDS